MFSYGKSLTDGGDLKSPVTPYRPYFNRFAQRMSLIRKDISFNHNLSQAGYCLPAIVERACTKVLTMERETCKSHIFPHVKDKLFDKARQEIDSLPSSAFYNSQFDYILFTKTEYCGENLSDNQKEKVKGFVLGAYTERMWREVRLKGEDRDTFFAEQLNLVRHIFGSIGCFQGLKDKDWRDIAEFYIRLSIMKEIMRKPNIHHMGHGAALAIGRFSSLTGGNSGKNVQRLVNVLHHVLLDTKTITSRQRRDTGFTAKRPSIKKQDYVLTSKVKAVSAHRTSTKITTFAIKEEGSVLIKREKKGRSSMTETVSQSPMTPQEEFSFDDALELLCATEFAEMTDLSETSLVQCGGDGHFDTLRCDDKLNMIDKEIDFDEAWGENDQTLLLESEEQETLVMEVMEGASDDYFTRAANAIGQTI
eukprot:gene29229-35281_t